MRQFMFRCWDKVEKKFTEQDFNLIGECIIFGQVAFQHCAVEKLNNFIITQAIGLIDKNDKVIYEGDILNNPNFPDDDYERCIVKYYPELARFGLEFYSPFGGEEYTGKEQHISDFVGPDIGCYIIGNIFENPELLNKPKE